ncbi:hypothetical protein KIH41_17270 [Litoribacter ruber]|uniref:glycosyltransferase n=1 Tax=Litoribacter ruber TaxID=702568 RepID=UPI001BDA7C8B|nr:glycosyltransferase [Litoribacter ruber]MBT0813042.1 hypothetical protein [Litoribacter ruber]
MAEKGFDPEEWLLERIDFFKKCCFPSILNQSNKNFTWFFYIDNKTPEHVKKSLGDIFDPFPFIKLIAHEYENFNITRYLMADIECFLGDDFDYLISSRVDTDDMLHKNFIETVQIFFGEQEYKVLNFSKGYVYDMPSGISSQTLRKANPFISLIEKRKNGRFQTVFCKPHTDFLGDPDYLEIRLRKPLWCMIVHGLNDSTSFYGSVNKFTQPVLKDSFGFRFQKKPKVVYLLSFSIRSYKRTIDKIIEKLKKVLS